MKGKGWAENFVAACGVKQNFSAQAKPLPLVASPNLKLVRQGQGISLPLCPAASDKGVSKGAKLLWWGVGEALRGRGEGKRHHKGDLCSKNYLYLYLRLIRHNKKKTGTRIE